jgi:hypothetical protein
MPHDVPTPNELLTPTDPDDARLIADLQSLYATPQTPDLLRQHGAEQVRVQFAQQSANAPSRFWGVVMQRGEPLPRATTFAAIAAVAIICLLAVALFQPGLFGLSGFSDSLRPHPTPNSAQVTQTAAAYRGIAPVMLSSVVMVSANDGWAFGTSLKNGCLVLHYDGHSWKRSIGSACGYVSSISMLSATDGWAVGYGYSNNPHPNDSPNYPNPDDSPQEILHYTHGAWQVQATFPTPNQATPQANQAQKWYSLHSLAMVSPTEGWAVGSLQTATSSSVFDFDVTALVLHYANGRWSPSSIAGLPASQRAYLMGISMVSANEGWAVGYDYDASNLGQSYMLILHYLNGAWSRVAWTHIGGLNGVDALSTGDIWAVGTASMGQTSAVVHLRDGIYYDLIDPVPGTLNTVQIFSTPAGWDGWAAGDGDATVHDQDSVWTREGYTIHGYTITSISLLSPSEGWAVGTNGGLGYGEYLKPNWTATLFHLHNGKWSIYPLTGF